MPHFEIYAADMTAARAFYGGLFYWTFTAHPMAEDMEYWIAEGAGVGEGQGLTLGMMTRPDTAHAPGTAIRGGTMTFEVDSCDDRYAWALANGGAEALPPTDYPGIGRAAYVEDGQGNVVGMITPAETEK